MLGTDGKQGVYGGGGMRGGEGKAWRNKIKFKDNYRKKDKNCINLDGLILI